MLRRAFFLFVAFPVVAVSQTMDAKLQQGVDIAIQRSMVETGAPSVSVAIVQDGRLVYTKAFGKADLASGTPATPATRYQIASISKTFVAEAVLLLVDEGKLTLEDPVSRWFPDLTEAKHVTVRQLLVHTSGYPDHYPESYPAGPKGRAATPDSIIAEWGRHPLLFPPGTQFHYSNLEYEIAGRIVEKVSGQSLFDFLRDRILRPVGVEDALDLDTIPDGSRELATGYVRQALGPLEPAPYEGPGWSFGSGQLVVTATDLAKWDIAFLQGKLLTPAMRKEETTRARLSTGATAPDAAGLFVSAGGDGPTRYYHSGQGLGFTAINMIYPETRTAFAILSNTSVGSIAETVMDQLSYLLITPSREDAYARAIFAGLQSGSPDTATWTVDLKSYLSGTRLKTDHDTLGALGPPESFVARPASTTDGLTTRDYEVVAGGRELRLHLLLLPNGKLEDATVSDARQR